MQWKAWYCDGVLEMQVEYLRFEPLVFRFYICDLTKQTGDFDYSLPVIFPFSIVKLCYLIS